MHTKPSFFFRRYSIQFLIVLSILFLSCSISSGDQVVISPDKIKSPTFRTSTAICYGPNAATHINLDSYEFSLRVHLSECLSC
jgi:hypothetical protein